MIWDNSHILSIDLKSIYKLSFIALWYFCRLLAHACNCFDHTLRQSAKSQSDKTTKSISNECMTSMVYRSLVYCTVLFAATTCMRGGNIYTLVQDTNCRSFTQSTAELPPQVHTCPPNLKFNMTLCNCVQSETVNCNMLTDLLSHSFFLRNSIAPHSERYFFENDMCSSM